MREGNVGEYRVSHFTVFCGPDDCFVVLLDEFNLRRHVENIKPSAGIDRVR
jgi:hypothetical protein